MESYNHQYTESKTTVNHSNHTSIIRCSTDLFTVVMQIKSHKINATANLQALANISMFQSQSTKRLLTDVSQNICNISSETPSLPICGQALPLSFPFLQATRIKLWLDKTKPLPHIATAGLGAFGYRS